MSSTCRFGRIWLPPNTVIVPLLTAWLVRMLTEGARQVLGHVGGIAHPIDRARGAVHEPLHARLPGRDHDRLEAIVVDGLRQLLVELEARVVGDAGEMEDGVLPD